MARNNRKKKSKNKPKGWLYLILFLCIVFAVYELFPDWSGKSSEKLEKQIKEQVEEVKEKAQEQVKEVKELFEETKEKIEEKKEEREERKEKEESSAEQQAEAQPSITTAPDKDAIELPAPLKNRPEKIMKRQGYITSYNKETMQPNWVAWELTPAKLVERESRTNDFQPDPDLKYGEAITTNDYKGSGWDRGHMCPAADSKWHWRAMEESFYMTNICPQNQNLNRGEWNELEEDCRRWAKKEGSVYIVCGPIFYNQKHEVIGRNHEIPVPEAFFKVILCLNSKPARAVGFTFTNPKGKKKTEVQAYSVDEVEKLTGIDFFPALPDNVERRVEAEYNLNLWK